MRYVFNPTRTIPDNLLEDVKKLKKMITLETGVEISMVDTYLLWDAISESWSASWLTVGTHYEDMTFREFIEDEMRKYGVVFYDE